MTNPFGRKRRRWLSTLIIAGALLVPAAVAYACVPSAAIAFDSPDYTYEPGQVVTVTGRQWPANADIQLTTTVPGVASVPTRSDSIGFFRASFGLPTSTPEGGYTVLASTTSGVPRTAREGFEVRTKPVGQPAPAAAPTPTAAPSRRARAVTRCKRRYRRSARRAQSRRAKRSAKRSYRRCVRRARRLPA